MATKVFASYDFEHDYDMKQNLITQSKRQDSPFAINDVSLNEKVPEWQQKARRAIESCDVFIVLLGNYTFQAQGVLREVSMARQLGKRRFQLRKQGHWPRPVEGGGKVFAWKWKNIKKQFLV